MTYVFKSTQQRLFTKRIFGFDIETYDDNKKFLLASIVGYDRYNNLYERVFFSREELITELKTNISFRNSVLFATNLGFDFFGTFFNTPEMRHFTTIFRGSDLLFAKAYYKGNDFCFSREKGTKSKQSRSSILFLDSLNYDKISVEGMGKVLGFPKLPSPEFGEYPKNQEEMDYMIKYNVRDSWITYKYMKFLISSFESLGATFKYTMASTSMSLFKNKYLGDRIVYNSDKEVLRDLLKAYYGGRTEALKRGYYRSSVRKKYRYYDFNSLYPSVMHDEEFPDPNSQRISQKNTTDFINNCEGVSHVTITIPKCKVPPLPYKTKDKVIFPYGTITGWWSNCELRHALNHGCRIEKVYKSIYYLLKCRPFKSFVTDLYNLRNKYKQDLDLDGNPNPMQKVIKLFMNSLYGKFGETFDDKEQLIHKDSVTLKDKDNSKKFTINGDFASLTIDLEPKSHCIPIWSIYVSAYGRIKLHKALTAHDCVYCDTDSIITQDIIPTSTKLGDLKEELEISEAITVRPKFYVLRGTENGKFKEKVKIKGLSKKLSWEEFKDLELNPRVEYNKFSKFKEAILFDNLPNEIIPTHKEFNLEDTKRDWLGVKFNMDNLYASEPLKVVDYNVANLKPINSPIISKGTNNSGAVAPTKKYANTSIIEPNIPMIELE